MALTLSNPSSQTVNEVWGRNRVVVKTVTFDSSYATGGESLLPGDLGLSEIHAVLVSVQSGGTPTEVQYNYTTRTLVALRGAMVEVAAATDLSALVVRVVVIGL